MLRISVLVSLSAFVFLPVLVSARVSLAQAQAFFADGDYALAARHYELASMRMPWRSDLQERSAELWMKASQPVEAIRMYEQARQRDHLSAQGWETLGTLYWDSGHWLQALRVWVAGLEQAGASPGLYDRLAMAYHLNYEYDAEQQMLEMWLALEPDNPQALFRTGKSYLSDGKIAGLALMIRAAQIDPAYDPLVQPIRIAVNQANLQSDRAFLMMVIGQNLASLGEWGLADQAFQNALRENTQYAEAWAWLGESRQQLGQDGAAYLEHALALNPDSAIVHALQARYFQRQGDTVRMQTAYQTAATLEPENPAWQVGLGDAASRNGQIQQALAYFQAATQLAPDQPLYWRLLALFCTENHIYLNEYGLPAAHRAVRLDDSHAANLDVLGWTYLATGDIRNARTFLYMALNADPGFALVHLHLGIFHLEQQEFEQARNFLENAIELDAGGAIAGQAALVLQQFLP